MFQTNFYNAFQSLTNSHENTFQNIRLLPIKQDFTIDINTSKDLQNNYFTQFKSLAQDKIFQIQENPKITGRYNLPKQNSLESKIDEIIRIKQPRQQYRYVPDKQVWEYQKKITKNAYYCLLNQNQAMKQNLETINRDLGSNIRQYFKGGIIKGNHQKKLDFKNLNYQTYSKAIAQEYSNILVQSLINNYGSLEIDQQIAIPGKYEVKQKKVHVNMATQIDDSHITIVDDSRSSYPNSRLTKTALMKMQIRKIKFKQQRNNEYFSEMEEKLVILFNYILQDDKKLRNMSTLEKIKLVLSDLDRFKHQQCEGQSKVSLLLFFFKQFQTLKQEKLKLKQTQRQRQRQTSKRKLSEQQLTRRQYSQTHAKNKTRMPQHSNTDHKIRIDDQQYGWIGLKGNRDS